MAQTIRKDDVLIKWVLGLLSALTLLYVSQLIKGINETNEFKYKIIRIEVMSEMTVTKINELSALVKATNKKQESQDSNIKKNSINIDQLTRYVKSGGGNQ